MTDQVAPSPQSLCDHPVYVHHMRGGEPLTIPLCQLCGEIGWDDLREQMAEHRRMVLEADQPEPCPLDHSCDEGEMCSCWCDLHDCPIAECPTFTLVERWITDMRTKHEATVAGLRRMVLAEAVDDLHRVAINLRATNPDSSVAKGVRYAEARIWAQLTAAPPAGLSAPVPAGNARAVPEEADGQRAGEDDALHAPDDVYRLIAADRAARWDYVHTLPPEDLAAYIRTQSLDRNLREDADAVWWAARSRYGNQRDRALAAAVDALSDAGTQPCPTPSDAKSGMVPLVDVLDALRDHDGFVDWTRTKGPRGYIDDYVVRQYRESCADYLAERFAPTAPEVDRG